MIKSWQWRLDTPEGGFLQKKTWKLFDGQGRARATIWQNTETLFTWHTWDDRGTGGENSEASSLNTAKDESVAAIVRQGWSPGGWKVLW